MLGVTALVMGIVPYTPQYPPKFLQMSIVPWGAMVTPFTLICTGAAAGVLALGKGNVAAVYPVAPITVVIAPPIN